MNEHYDMGTPEEFEEQMNDASNREIVFKTLQKHYRLDNAPDQYAFDDLMGYGLNAGAVDAAHGVVPGGNVQQMNQQKRAELAERMKQQQNGNMDAGGQNVASSRGYQQFKQGYNQYMQQGGVKAQPQQQVAAQETAPAQPQPQQTQTNYVEMPTQERYYQQAVNPARPAYMQNDEAWAKMQEEQKQQNERAEYQKDFNKWFDAYGKPALDAVNDEAAKKLNAEMQTSIQAGDRSARYGMMMSDRDENPVTAVDKVSKALAGQMSDFVLMRMGIDPQAMKAQNGRQGAQMSEQEVEAFDQMFEDEYKKMADALQRRIYNEYARKHAPKNTLEYVASSMMHNSLVGTVRDLVLTSLSKNEAVRLQLINQGMAQYDANMAEEAVAGAATMMADAPAFMVGSYFGNMLTKGVTAGVKAVTGKTVAPAVVKGLAMVNNSFFSWGGYGAASSYANKVKEGVYAGLDAGDMNYMKHALQNASVTEALKEGAVEGVKGVAIGALGMGVKAATRNVGLTGRIATDIGMVPLEAASFVTIDAWQRHLNGEKPMTAEEMMRDYGKQVMMIGLLHGKAVLMSGGREYSKDHYDENGKLVQGAYTADGRVKKELAAQLMNDTDIEMLQKGSFGQLFADVKDSRQMMEVLDNAWAGNGKMVWEAIVENEAYPMMMRARVAAAHGRMIAVPRATQSQVVEGTDNGGHYLVTYASDGKILDSVRYETKAKAEKAARELEPMLEDQSVMELEDIASCADYTTEDVLSQLTAGNPEREERIMGAMERMENGTATKDDMDTMDVVRQIINDAKNDRRETVLSKSAMDVYEQNGIDPREALKKRPDHRTEEDKLAIALYKERISDNMAREMMSDEEYAVSQDTDSETGTVKYGTDAEGRRVIVKGTGDSVIVTDVETGETRMEDVRYVTVTEERTPAEELMARKNAEMQAEQAMQQEAGAQSETTVAEAEKPTETAETIAEEELPSGALAAEGTPIKYYDENNDLVEGTYIGPDHMQNWKHVIKDRNGRIVSRRLEEDEIVLPEVKAETTAAPVAEAPVAPETPVAPENVNGMGTAQVAAPENGVGAGMPLNAKGKPDPIGNGVTPERALQYLEQERGMEPDVVKELIDGQVKKAGEDIAKYAKKKPDASKMDPDDYIDAYEQWKQGGMALREVENRWKAIAGEIKAREEAVKAEQERIRKEQAAAEEAERQKQWEIQRKETEERERKQREFMAELERQRQEQEALEAEQANEELTGDEMAEQAVMDEQKRRERMRIGQRLAEVGQQIDLDQPADEAMAAQVAYLSPDFKVTPESLRLEMGSNFGKFGREGMLRLADSNGRTISDYADSIVQAAGYDANGQWRLDANTVREELINCIREGSASAIEALEKRVGIGTQRPEDRPEYWTEEKIAEYEARQKELEGMTEVQRQIAEASEMVNTSPTDGQKEAGNYKKGHVKLDGMEISIEQPKGSTRSGVDADGLPWSVRMNNTYGYIRGTKGKDKDHIDIYLSDNPEEGNVFVVDQIDPRTGEFDEHKVMYGFNSLEEAREAYLSNYMSDWKGLGNITEVNKTAFKVWLSESVHKTKPFADYRLVKAEQAKMGMERGYEAVRDPFAQDRTNEFLNGNEGMPETIEGDAPFHVNEGGMPSIKTNAERETFLAETLGLKVTVLDHDPVEGVDGMIGDNGEVIVSSNSAKGAGWLISHETGHRVEQLSPEKYDQYKKAAIGSMTDDELSALIKKKQDFYKNVGREISEDQAMSEIANDMIGDIFEDPAKLESFIKKTEPTVWRTMLNVIEDVWNTLTGNSKEQAYQIEKKLRNAIQDARKKQKIYEITRKELSIDEKAAAISEISKSTLNMKDGEITLPESDVRLSDERDQDGRKFVMASDGSTDFGSIEGTSLTEAPIKLSSGHDWVDENGGHHGYGLVHMEIRHLNQLRQNGFNSVEEFVEFVAKNYDKNNIRKSHTGKTYFISVVDQHANTLYLELSRDGSYWNVNSGGVFGRKYLRNKELVAPLPTVGVATTAGGSVVRENNGGNPLRGNSTATNLSGRKVTNISDNNQINEGKTSVDGAKKLNNGTELHVNESGKRYDEDKIKLDENNYAVAMYDMGMKYLNEIHDELDGLRYMVSYDKDGNRVNQTWTRGRVGQFEYTHFGQNDIVGYRKVDKNGKPYDPVYGRDLYKDQWESLEEPMREYKEFYERMAEKAPQAWMKADLMSKARGVEVRMERMKQLAEGVEPTNAQFGRWAAEDNGKNSVRYRDYEGEDPKLENVNNTYNEQLSKYTSENADSIVLDLGSPSEILKKAGVEDKPMKLYGSKIAKKMKKHGYEANDLRDLPRAMANPIAVFDNYDKDGNRSVLTELEVKDGNILVAVDLGKGGDIDFNIISSAFGKGEGNIEDWLRRGLATYIDNEKVQDYLHLAALSAAASDNTELSSGAKVGKNGELNKYLGEKLYVRTENFKNWFGDWQKNPKNSSKVVDKNGEPLVVYHGTLAKGIQAFDKDMIGSRYSYDEKGFFFTDKENIAKDYSTSEFDQTRKGEVIPVYLNLRKPLVVNREWCRKNGMGDPLKDMDAIEFWDTYQSLMLEESVKNDGIIIDDGTSKMYVAFEPNQIKHATENNGDFKKNDERIRYNRTYHGSAADFEEFDHKFMGSGEGSQVYGWGTYVSEVEGIAKSYADIATSKKQKSQEPIVYWKGQQIDFSDANPLRMAFDLVEDSRTIAEARERAERYAGMAEEPEMQQKWQAALDALKQSTKADFKREPVKGNRKLYDVEIPDDNGKNYLSWKEPVTDDQLERIAKVLKEEDLSKIKDFLWKDIPLETREEEGDDIMTNGEYLKEYLSQEHMLGSYGQIQVFLENKLGYSPEYISKSLSKAGFVGIKVPTNNMRAGDKSNKNYVIFDEKNAKIVSKEYFRRGEGVKPTVKPEVVTEAAKGMAEKLHKEVKVCQNADEISDESVKAAVKKAEAEGRTPTRKGWFNTRTGEIEVYAPAAESVEDVKKTVLHETVGHYGLRELLSDSEQDYNNAMVEMYRLMNDKQKKEVQKMMADRKYDVATAMDEYLAKMAEDRGNMVEPTFWEKAKSVVKNLLRKIRIDVELTDGDLKYLLWSSHEALKNSREVTNADGSKSRVYDRKTMDQKAADWAMRWHNDVLGLRSKWEAERNVKRSDVRDRDTDPDDDPTTPGGGGSTPPTGGRERSLEEMIDYDAQEFKREFERMKTENDQITLGARVREFIRNRMTPLAGKRMTASDINGLMRDVDYAITHKSKKGLERALNRMQTLIHQAEGLAQIEEMMKTLNTRTTTVDKKGMVKGVLVDEAANEVLNNIKSSYKQMLSTSYDERLSEVRREMRALKEQYGITRQDDPAAPEEFKTRMQELKEKQDALKAERDGVLSSQVEETIESLNTLEEDINNQIGNLAVNEDGDAVTPNATKLERLTQEKLTIEIRKKLAELRQMMSAKQEIQKELDRTGSPKERQRLEEEIDKMQRRINITSRGITEELKDIISEGRSRRAEFVKADMERQMRIVRMGCNAVRDKDVPDTLDKKNSRTNWQSVQGWFADKRDMLQAPIFSFNFMAKYIDHNNAQGDGEFYNYFMRGENGALEANNEYSKGVREFGEAVNEKCKEIFGKGIDKVKREAAKLTDKKITKLVPDKSIPEEEWSEKHVRMTKGQMLYAWLTWRQEAGRTKMQADGWTKRSIEEMQEQLGPEMLELGRWMTDDFLKALRDDKYNVTYEKVMGTSMHKAAHYFPLRIDKLGVQEKSEVGQDGTINLLPSASSGNLIVRTTNRLPVDLSNDAFDVLEDYGRTMERWNAMAELTKDLNTLIKSQGFRNLMEANHEGLFERWKDACAVATASYNTKATDTDKFLSTLHNGFMQQAIGYGYYTAIKQTLSAPAFWLYSWDPRYWGKEIWYGNVFRSWSNYKWAKEHLPSFAERIAANDFGIEAINDKSIVDKLTRIYKKGGMAANKLVDAVTVANGARAVYEYDKGRFMKMKNEDGSRKYTDEQADELAKVNAQIVFNESQQSSRNEFSSPIQKQRGIVQRSMVAFQNSNIGYRRMLVEGLEDIVRKDGNKSRGFAKVLTVGILNAAWYMGLNPALAYNKLTGKTDDEEDEKFWDGILSSVVLGYLSNGTILGPAMTAWTSEFGSYNPIQVFDLIDQKMDEAKKQYKKDDMGAMSWAVIDNILKFGGVNLEKFDGMYNAFYNAIKRGGFKADDLWSFLNLARTQRRELANHDLEDKTATEYMVDVMRADKKIEEGDRGRGWWNGDAYNKVLTDEKRTEIINDYVKKSVPDFEPVKKKLEDANTLVDAKVKEIKASMPKAKPGKGEEKDLLALNQAIDEVLKDDPEMLKVYKRYVNSTAGRVEKKGKWVNETYAEKHTRLTKALADAVKALEDGSGSYTRVDNAAMELIWLEDDILKAMK